MNVITTKLTRREREREKRIELILDNAERLFLEKGFAATTMSDLGSAAEFGRATLYHYFPSKEAIYVAIVERALDSMIARSRESVARARNSAQKIEKLKDVLLSFVQRKRNIFHLYFITRFEVFPYLDGGLRKRLESKIREFDELFHDIYREGIVKGELKPEDPLIMGDIFFAQIVGLMLLNSAEILEPPLASIVAKATGFFLDNIGARSEGRRMNK